MRAEFPGQRGVFRPAADGGDLVAEFTGKLNSKVPQAADALHGNEVRWHSPAVAEGIEGGDSRAHQRTCLCGIQALRHGCERFDRGEHVFLIAAVIADAGNFQVEAIRKISAAASNASAVLPAVPANADALAFFPARDASAHVINHSGDFVSGRTRILNAREESFFCDEVAVADATSLHANAHVPGGRVWNFTLDDFKIRSRFWHLCHFHLCHRDSPLLKFGFKLRTWMRVSRKATHCNALQGAEEEKVLQRFPKQCTGTPVDARPASTHNAASLRTRKCSLRK